MKLLLLAGLLAATLPLAAQTAPAFVTTCQPQGQLSDHKNFCETRDLTLPASAGQTLTIDGGRNGGITVKGWDGTDVRVRAKVTTWADTDAAAQAQAKAVSISTSGHTLRALVPNDAEGTAVSFEVFVPRQQALALSTRNGGIHLSGLHATVTFEAQNGGVHLADLGGHVTGHTTNGGLHIALSGARWDGAGLDVSTTNGGITWQLPAEYSAQFSTRTQNGSLRTALPVEGGPHGTRRTVNATLGKGGQPVQAATTNGGITIKQG